MTRTEFVERCLSYTAHKGGCTLDGNHYAWHHIGSYYSAWKNNERGESFETKQSAIDYLCKLAGV